MSQYGLPTRPALTSKVEQRKTKKRTASSLLHSEAPVQAFGYHSKDVSLTHFFVVLGSTFIATMFIGLFVARISQEMTGTTTADKAFIGFAQFAIYVAVLYCVIDLSGGDVQLETSLPLLFYAIQHANTGVSRKNSNDRSIGMTIVRTGAQWVIMYLGYGVGLCIAAGIGGSIQQNRGLFTTPGTDSLSIWIGAVAEGICSALLAILFMSLRDRESAYSWPLSSGLLHGLAPMAMFTVSGGVVNVLYQLAAATVAAFAGNHIHAGVLGVSYVSASVVGALVGTALGSLGLLYIRVGPHPQYRRENNFDHEPLGMEKTDFKYQQVM